MLVERCVAQGAFLLTPGWVVRWREQIGKWEFDQATARAFFHESCNKLVLFDTGVYGDCEPQLSAMGAYLDLPIQTVPVGLDMLRFSLLNLVMELREKGKPLPPPDHFFSDQLMIIDLLNVLLAAESREEALGRIEELFMLFFAPGRLNYVETDRPDDQECEKTLLWTKSGRGFILPLHFQKEHFGLLEIDDLSFAQYKERYAALAVPLAKMCSVAIFNAKNRERHLRSERALQKMASIVGSSKDAIIGKTLDGIVMSWNKGAEQIFG